MRNEIPFADRVRLILRVSAEPRFYSFLEFIHRLATMRKYPRTIATATRSRRNEKIQQRKSRMKEERQRTDFLARARRDICVIEA